MPSSLTAGSLEAIMNGQACDRPVLQVLGFKKIPSGGGLDRYRFLLSDGVNSVSSAMLATQMNDKIVDGSIEINCLIRLDKYICNIIQGEKRVIVLLDISVIESGNVVGNRIGNPQPIRQGEAGPQNTVANGSSVESTSIPNQRGQALNSYTEKTITKYSADNQNKSNFPLKQSNPVKNLDSNTSSFGQQNNFNKFSPAAQNNLPNKTSQKMNSSVGLNASSVDTPTKIYPISSLTPYQNRWTIKARVTLKSAIRTWSNSKGEGQLFSMNLLDESGEIRATAFKNEVDKFYNLLEVNKVYYIRKCVLKAANKQFSNLANDYEMTLSSETEIIPCDDDEQASVPTVTFNFVPLDKFEDVQPNTLVDVIGIAKETDDLKIVMSQKTNKEIKKRDIVLVDESRVQIRLTLWGNDAEAFNGQDCPVIAMRGCRVSDWGGGRSLTQSNDAPLIINPNIRESHRLRGWYDMEGCNISYQEYKKDGSAQGGSSNTWKNLDEIKAQNLSLDKPDYFMVKGLITFIKKENCLYQACPQPDCNKKVIDGGNGTYRCEKCSKDFNSFKWRLLLSISISDSTDNAYATCFQDTAETILGRKADEIGYLRENDPSSFELIFTEAVFKQYTFKLRSKMEHYNDEDRLKNICVQVNPINYIDHSHRLIGLIEKLLSLS